MPLCGGLTNCLPELKFMLAILSVFLGGRVCFVSMDGKVAIVQRGNGTGGRPATRHVIMSDLQTADPDFYFIGGISVD